MTQTAVPAKDAPALDYSAACLSIDVETHRGQHGQRLWGRTLLEMHDWYWASRGLQVLRRGTPIAPTDDHCRLLLLEPAQLVLFDMPTEATRLLRSKSVALRVMIHDSEEPKLGESLHTTDDGQLRAVHRDYTVAPPVVSAAHVTNDCTAASVWNSATGSISAARTLRAALPFGQYLDVHITGQNFDSHCRADHDRCRRMLLARWIDIPTFDSSVMRVKPNVWAHETATVPPSARFVGPVWIGAGVTLEHGAIVIGPHIINDVQPTTPRPTNLQVQPIQIASRKARFDLSLRRAFDVCFSLFAIACSLPLWPIIALAIWIDDGWPILYRHRRQTIGGHSFDCLKFRTMRTNADEIKAALQSRNICDGPQFYIENDPRETRVGRVLRKFHFDELPQFLNVLAGHMSIVGPRPSPEIENRFCPAWRATRLSVKPGITGLWQVRRTRQPDADFQEWIRYDTEYVRTRTWWMDVRIIARTLRQMLPI